MISKEELEQKLRNYWQVDELKVYGKFHPHPNGKIGFFNGLRNLKGDLLYYPKIEEIGLKFTLASAFVSSPGKLIKDQYYLFTPTINPNREHWNKTPLFVENQDFKPVQDEVRERIKAEEFIKSVNNRIGESPGDAKRQAKALQNFQMELYTKTERFIFELLQNADDFPGDTDYLSVRFVALNENILFAHNGLPFRGVDVESICSIGESTKSKTVEATGYKGIGFKSVFTHSSRVYVSSGKYRFSFDRDHEQYKSFERLYPNHTADTYYKGKWDKFTGSENVPWQLKPIWREWYRYPEEVQKHKWWFEANVGICLEFGKQNVNEFERHVYNLVSEPRFMLFLKNIKQIQIHTKEYGSHHIVVERNGDVIGIKNEKQKQQYLRYTTNNISFEDNRAEFESIENIPKKITEYAHFSISFATKIDQENILTEEDSIIFTYLPTEDRRYQFPFIVNSDFITNSNREQILPSNKWNIFVFEHIGYELFNWLKTVVTDRPEFKSTYLRLLPKKFDKDGEIYSSFNKGYEKGTKEIAFLPTVTGEPVTVNEAVFDKAGLFPRIDPSLLQKIEKFKGLKLIDPNVEDEEGILEYLGIKTFSKNDLEVFLNQEEIRETLIGNYSQLCDLLKVLFSLPRGKQLIKQLCNTPLIKVEEEKYLPIKSFRKGVPGKYTSLFSKLDIVRALPEELEEKINDDEDLQTIFIEVFEMEHFVTQKVITLLNSENVKSFFKDNSKEQGLDMGEMIDLSILMWQFLFENKDLQANGQIQVDARFQDAIILDSKGQLVELKECKLEKKRPSQSDQSFLYQKYGNKSHHLLNLDKLEFGESDEDEVRAFVKQIFPEVEITNYRLFKETFNTLKQSKFEPIVESSSEDVIQAGLEFFRLTKQDKYLLKDVLVAGKFPVLTRSGEIVHAKEVYLGSDYKKIAQEEDFYAEELWQGIEGIYFLSVKYLEKLPEGDYGDFLKFLKSIDIKPGLKVYRGQDLKRNYRLNIKNVDLGFSNYNNGYTNFKSNDNFSIIRHMSLLSEKNERLQVLWDKLKGLWPNHNFYSTIVCNGYRRRTPFLYLLSQFKLIPTKDGAASSKEIYDPALTEKFSSLKKPLINFDQYPNLEEKLTFTEKIQFQDLLKILTDENLDQDGYNEIISRHLINLDLNEEEVNSLKETVKFRSISGAFKPINDLLYIDDEIKETPLVNLLTQKSDLADNTVDKLNLGKEGERFFERLGIKVVTKDSISFDTEISSAQEITRGQLLAAFNDFDEIIKTEESENTTEEIIANYELAQCEKIALTLDGVQNFSQEVNYFIHGNKLHYRSARDVIEAVSIQIGEIPDNVKREIEERIAKKSNEIETAQGNDTGEIQYSNEHVEAIKKLFDGDVPEEFYKNLNLAALVSALVNLPNDEFDVDLASTNLDDTHEFAQIQPVYKSDDSFTIMCRSARQGLLYLTAQAWNRLDDTEIKLYADLGNGKYHLYSDKQSVLNSIDSDVEFQILRIESESDLSNIEDILTGHFDASRIWIIFKVKAKTKFDPIFYKSIQPDNTTENLPPSNNDSAEIPY